MPGTTGGADNPIEVIDAVPHSQRVSGGLEPSLHLYPEVGIEVDAAHPAGLHRARRGNSSTAFDQVFASSDTA